jgi:cell division septation protein DedD
VEITNVPKTDKIALSPQVGESPRPSLIKGGEYILDKSYPYTILVASFADETLAYQNAEQIEKLGYAVYVSRVDSSEGALFYVSVGRFKNIEAAQDAAERLKKEFPYVEVIQNPTTGVDHP